MDIFKIIGIGIITVICVVILKQVKPELSVFVSIAGSIAIILIILNTVGDVFGGYRQVIDKTGLNGGVFSCVLKVIGIGYLVDFAGGICADAGVSSIADKILLGGKILILVMCMPVINNLIEIVLKLVP